MPIARATGALGNTSCLVGTAEQVAAAILEYYKLGVGSVLIRGFDPMNDTVEFGRELIPRIKAGAAERDRLQRRLSFTPTARSAPAPWRLQDHVGAFSPIMTAAHWCCRKPRSA